jgi:hypothetical protein
MSSYYNLIENYCYKDIDILRIKYYKNQIDLICDKLREIKFECIYNKRISIIDKHFNTSMNIEYQRIKKNGLTWEKISEKHDVEGLVNKLIEKKDKI